MKYKRRPVWKVVRKNRRSFVIKNKKYKLVYEKNKIIKARKDTFGVFCFKTKEYASRFIGIYNWDVLLLKVEPIGKGKKPNRIGLYNHLKNFYKKPTGGIDPPLGTICYPSVKVLE